MLSDKTSFARCQYLPVKWKLKLKFKNNLFIFLIYIKCIYHQSDNKKLSSMPLKQHKVMLFVEKWICIKNLKHLYVGFLKNFIYFFLSFVCKYWTIILFNLLVYIGISWKTLNIDLWVSLFFILFISDWVWLFSKSKQNILFVSPSCIDMKTDIIFDVSLFNWSSKRHCFPTFVVIANLKTINILLSLA